MEPPVVPFNPRTRLTRDYTSDDEPSQTSPQRLPTGQNDELAPSILRPSLDSQADTIRPNGSKVYRKRENGTMSPQGRISTEPRSQESPLSRPQHGETENQEHLGRLEFDLETVDENTSYEPSISTASHMTQNTGMTSTSGGRLPDFFAPEVFQTVLHNPTTSHQLLRFSQSRLCGENMEFLEKVDKYNTLLNDVAKYMFEIHRDYISVNAVNQINIPEPLLIKVNKDLKKALASTLPTLESVFVDSQNDIERLVAMDIYPRFVRHQMTMSATRALAGNRGKYAGLGDCFVLTDPAKADNPILFASEGFVKVTGYARNEIIPRNCRFLQTRHTDISAVRRLKQAIDDRKESVELLLNQKKNGEPFWNLLYTTPLFDASGTCVFFLGGQINCSTTVHNASDVLKLLSQSQDTDERAVETVAAATVPKNASRTSRFLSSLRSKSYQEPQRTAGMEDGLVNKIEKMNLRKQMDAFYSAYSKFIVVNYSTFYISFHSAGIANFLYPTKPMPQNNIAYAGTAQQAGGQIIGMDIFRFFATHCPGSKLNSEFKARAKGALKYGNAVSLDLTLCTRRYMGFEKFISHWTPLKDEHGQVTWIVLTLAGASD